MAARYPFLDYQGVPAFAHRGGTIGGPENTMAAFQYAVDLGYRYLETDVHLSADGVLYAFHDDYLAARTGVPAYFGDLDAAEIDRLRVDGTEPIPRLDEILTTWPRAMVNIDTKSDATVLPLIASIRAHGAIDRVCVGSFVDRRIKLCRAELGPQLCTSMGRLEAARLVLAAKGLVDPSLLVAPCAQLPVNYHRVDVTTPRLVEVARELEIDVHVWTVNDRDEMRRLMDMGVDALMTDDPGTLRHVLIETDRWQPDSQLAGARR